MLYSSHIGTPASLLQEDIRLYKPHKLTTISNIQTQLQAVQLAQAQSQRDSAGRVTMLTVGIIIVLLIALILFAAVAIVSVG